MGPRSFNRGNAPVACAKAGGDDPSMGPRSFNRGNPPSKPRLIPSKSLQWGRGHSTAETRCHAPSRGIGYRSPSMGPRSFNRGNRLCAAVLRRLFGGTFNGAAVIQPRKRQSATLNGMWSTLLQWGRGHSTAETVEGLISHAAEKPPSMGPRSFNRGNVALITAAAGDAGPSMGPRSFNRGNNLTDICERTKCSILQWGRGHSTAETLGHNIEDHADPTVLQWGRGHSTAETGLVWSGRL